MDLTITGTITAVSGPNPVIDRKTNQPTGATETLFRVEEYGEQYPDSVILRIYEKDGGNSKVLKAFEGYQGFQGVIQAGMPGTFHFHMRGSMGVSQTTGKPYAINDTFVCWKAENAAAATIPVPQPQQQFGTQYPAPQQPYAQQQPQQFAQPAYGAGGSVPGMSTQGFQQPAWNINPQQ